MARNPRSERTYQPAQWQTNRKISFELPRFSKTFLKGMLIWRMRPGYCSAQVDVIQFDSLCKALSFHGPYPQRL
ncbi:hypothetical protein Ddc_14576 [Ditylenchus destructor]|nr:hypothetical protein Ddc_14576 [Ditylenchus destructor]